MEEIRLCDSEYRFLQVVWEAAPVPSGQLAELCRQRLGWKKSTVYTVLKKMCEKGLLQNENALVTVLVPRERVTAAEAEQFVDRTFGGSLPGFLAAFMSGKKLTAREAEEVKRLIDQYREE
ncbi:BlaI/MecI/CopY family transcriptional regulator [Dysosmobacter sp.]|uniref:BlaI/MecI/CopY family transcriptional regulator n=1 Tax=Dysosmobacter sp. TaxID=2591382 RepID=UPI002A866D25|nr:BlaI/MecI/CopY family transcriptional regulator [Dysosmobacter sp.]MDY3282343.1 BlaI/MecI/CopY family transcriptional regulator [Dysosmobacter sp.]